MAHAADVTMPIAGAPISVDCVLVPFVQLNHCYKVLRHQPIGFKAVPHTGSPCKIYSAMSQAAHDMHTTQQPETRLRPELGAGSNTTPAKLPSLCSSMSCSFVGLVGLVPVGVKLPTCPAGNGSSNML
jgi:hypothetical protein